MAAAAAIKKPLTIALPSSISISDLSFSPADAEALLRLEPDGDIWQFRLASSDDDIGDWMSPNSGAPGGNYEARVTVTSGTLSSGTAGSWLALSANRDWARNRISDSPGTQTCVFTLEIRDASTLVVLATSTVTLSAEVA